jgi:hypothetical protein
MMVTGPDRCQLTSTTSTAGGQTVHRSWVTWSDRLPEPCYATVEFRHVRPDPILFEVQERLPAWQDRSGMRFAGSWVRGWDCHETAVASAVGAASAIDPSLPRLASFAGVVGLP